MARIEVEFYHVTWELPYQARRFGGLGPRLVYTHDVLTKIRHTQRLESYATI